MIQCAFLKNPLAVEVIKAEQNKEGKESVYVIEHMRDISQAFINEINDFMQDYRVLCVSTQIDSEKMWSGYAENHKGIALRIEPNVAKDSKFQLFRPVEYCTHRPSLYDDTLEFVADALFGDHEVNKRAIIEKIVCTKTLCWEHEAEYRLAIAFGVGEHPCNILKFHPEEITELYLGHAMTSEEKDEIAAKGNKLNPEISIFEVVPNTDHNLTFSNFPTATT